MHADFLSAICAEPDDLTHRLVYADWLTDHGSTPLDAARADLIRVQIAREAADPDGDDYWTLRGRERALLGGWHGELPGDLSRLAARCSFRCGFVEWVEIDSAVWASHAEAICRATPLRAVTLRGHVTGFDLRAAGHLRGLDLRGVEGLTADTAGAAGGWPRLDLNPFTASAFLGAAGEPPALASLGLWSGEETGLPRSLARAFPVRFFRGLFGRPAPPGLRSLTLAGSRSPAGGNQALLDSAWLSGLESLRLTDAGASDRAAFIGLLSCHRDAGRLRSLRSDGLGDVEAVPEHPGPMLRQLRHLHLADQDPVSDYFPAFLRGLEMGDLRSLTLGGMTDRPETSPLFRSWHLWPRLRSLTLTRVERRLSDEVVAGPYPAQLRALEMPVLLAGGFPPSLGPLPLVELRLSGGVPTSVRAVAGSALPNLASLEIGHAKLDDPDDLAPLLDRDRFPRLCWLDLGGVRVREPWLARLRERLGRGFRLSARPLSEAGPSLVYEE